MHLAHDECDFDVSLVTRVYSEYMEMPGLRLTLAQASRLWNMTPTTSANVLDRLVKTAFLRRAGDRYVRADSGRGYA